MLHQQRVTIKDVAKAANVSTQTVSRVVNERPDVAPDTRKRVLEIIENLGYQPSELARSLIQQRSYMLGVVTAGLKYIGGPGRALNGITTAAEDMGYALLLKEIPHFTANNIQTLIQSLLARQVDGILWAVPEIGDNHAWIKNELSKLRVPAVFLSMQARPGVASVAFDNYTGGRLATQHLVEIGRRRIGHIAGPVDWWEARERVRAYEDTLSEAGLLSYTSEGEQRRGQSAIVYGNWSAQSGAEAFQQMMDTYPDLDAVFVANDQMALSVLRQACRRNLRVPIDLAVVGFDDLAESSYFWPSLTTIRQDQSRLGYRGVVELVNRIESLMDGIVPPDPVAVILTPELIVRESTVK